jgi:putative endonuclease
MSGTKLNERKSLGNLGEGYATMFLVKHGFAVIDRNYTEKTGEIDIIVEKGGNLHFVEVKTVSRETQNGPGRCFTGNIHRAEDNVDSRKLKKIERTAEIFMAKHGYKEKDFQIDLITVEFVVGNKTPFLNYIPNVNL